MIRRVRHASALGRWEFVFGTPDPRLAAYVRGYHGYDEVTPGPMRRAELPAAKALLILDLGEPLTIHEGARATPTPRGGFAGGLDDRPALVEHGGAMRGVQVDLTLAGARLCFGVPMHELTGRTVGLADVLGPAAPALVEALHEDATWEARFARIDRALAARIAGAGAIDRGIAWAWAQLAGSGGRAPIGGLARELGISHRLLIARFATSSGWRRSSSRGSSGSSGWSRASRPAARCAGRSSPSSSATTTRRTSRATCAGSPG